MIKRVIEQYLFFWKLGFGERPAINKTVIIIVAFDRPTVWALPSFKTLQSKGVKGGLNLYFLSGK